MSIVPKLARSLGVNNEQPNKELGQQIATSNDKQAIDELILILSEEQDPDVLADLLKVAEIIGEIDPRLIRDSFEVIFQLTAHPRNKIQWRAMCALSTISQFHLQRIHHHLPELLDLMEKGSIIARDHGMQILLGQYQIPEYQDLLLPILREQLLMAPNNQLGQYAEKWNAVICPSHRGALISILEDRQPDLNHPSHQKRIARVLSKLRKPA